jgi:hypothetical protein
MRYLGIATEFQRRIEHGYDVFWRHVGLDIVYLAEYATTTGSPDPE